MRNCEHGEHYQFGKPFSFIAIKIAANNFFLGKWKTGDV